MDPTTGYAFTGMENIHNDIYPSISAAQTPSLQQSGKVVLITGAGRGIGRAIALQYAHASVASIILCARTSSELDEVAGAISKINSSVKVLTYTVDVTIEEQVAKLAQTVEKDLGRLDILVNNAGASSAWVPITDSKPSNWWKTVEINVKGPYLFVHSFLPLLLATAEKQKTNANVVNLTSIGTNFVLPTSSAYNVSKHALTRFTEFINAEYGDKGISAVSVNPGGVPTKLAEEDIGTIGLYLVDTPELCGGTVVWLTAESRPWLNGRYLSSTWDVDALVKMKDEIVAGDKLKPKMVV